MDVYNQGRATVFGAVMAPYQLSDIHTAADIQECGVIGEGQGFELTRLRLAIKSYAIVKKSCLSLWCFEERTKAGER